ncbi:hypothetical protein QQ020_03045 [Fulvivirgaceae bacterium BMA12]|uniref:Uncharacterized protein n=1 Tax=Agaribacillus aureus TaxID=3051825 RepID=A0ABT8KZT9_9BACT|nr:hypothetical protein [Fulvivirgaceae bacterium BMA12]
MTKIVEMKKYLVVVPLLLFDGIVSAQSIQAPIDHRHPEKGSFDLQYEFGAPYNPNLPTVMVIADAQQFYVVKGRLKKIQAQLFGDKMNVLGVISRSNVSELRQRVINSKDSKVDWLSAYAIFQAFQYVSDIELVRSTVLAGQKEVYLYGQSGGAFLITEYLSAFPDSPVKKVFIGASVNPVIEARLGIVHDNFQRDFLAENPEISKKLDQVIAENFFDRKLVARLFQRQNFFVKLADLHDARLTLTDRLMDKDTIYINGLKKSYQIDALEELAKSDFAIPIKVRIFEFIAPLLGSWAVDGPFRYPDLENSRNTAYPLIEAFEKGGINFSPLFKDKSAGNFKGEVFVLAGRHDHVADYRSSIYLSALFENNHLFIADDDHTFKSLKSDNNFAQIVQDFFLNNHDINWIDKYSQYKWREE